MRRLDRHRHRYIPKHSHARLALILTTLFIGWGSTGCDDEPKSRSIGELVNTCSEQEMMNDEGACIPRSTPAHPPQCITVDGALCLINVTVRDAAPRPGALTPGERAALGEMMIFNSGDSEVRLTRLSALVTSPHLTLDQEDWSREPVTGSEWVEDDRMITVADRQTLKNACSQGRLPPREGCTISLDLLFSVNEDAPVNASQRVELESESQRGARFSWSLPLNIVDAVEGLEVDEVSLEDSTEDGALNPGDRARFTRFSLLNSSFAPFSELSGLITGAEDQVEFIGELERWTVGDERVEGLTSATIYCPQATSDDTRALRAGRCELEIDGALRVDPQLEGDELTLTLYLRDRGVDVGAPMPISLTVSPWEPDLIFEGLRFESDGNRDLIPSPGERMTIRYITLENRGESSISLRGRVSLDSPHASLSGASDVSVDETQLREEFYERCPAQSSCELEVNLIIDIDDDAPLGARIPLSVELLDQAKMTHVFESQFELELPDVELRLEDIEVTQDTLDTALSPGERGLISYLKFVNVGLADALGLSVQISVDSDYVEFEDERDLSFGLNASSNDFEGMQSACPSVSLEPDGYCYTRSEIPFRIAEDTPLGEELVFVITVTDLWGTTHEMTHTVELF